MEESGGLNLYGFVGNDGIGTFDYLGMCDVLTGDVIGSGVAGAVYGFVESRVKKRLLKAAITAIPVVGEIIAGGVVAWDVVSGGIAIGKLAVNRDAITDRIKEIFEDPDLEMWFDCIPQADCVRLSFLLGQVFGDSILGGKGLKASTIKAHNKVKDFVRKLKGGGKKKALSRLNDSDTVKPATESNVDPTDVGPGSAAKKPLWGSWNDYSKVSHGGREYAQVGDRLYSHHAVDRMQPSGLGAPAGAGSAGRSIAPAFVDDVIQKGTTTTKMVDGVERTIHTSGSVQVVTEQGGKIVVTINPFSGGK